MSQTTTAHHTLPGLMNEIREQVAQQATLGQVDFLNMYPMHWSLGIEPTVTGVPTTINKAIVDGEVSAACMSSIEYGKHAESMWLLPSLCVSSRGAVGSIFVVSTCAFDEITRTLCNHTKRNKRCACATTLTNARASYAVHTLEKSVTDTLALGKNIGVLIIGDDALRAHSSPEYAGLMPLILGERWMADTGLPFVYAVWAARNDRGDDELWSKLDALLQYGVQKFMSEDDAVDQAAQRYDFSDVARSYYDNLYYEFGPMERKGLVRFGAWLMNKVSLNMYLISPPLKN